MERFRRAEGPASGAGRVLLLLVLLFPAFSLGSVHGAEAQGRVSRGQPSGGRRHEPPPPPPASQVFDPFDDRGRFAVAHLVLDGQPHEVTVAPGATIAAHLDVFQDCPRCGNAINQIIVGFAGAPEAQACVWNGGARSNGWEHTQFTLVAPNEPGDYEVRVRYAQAYGCERGALGWWRVDRPNGPGPESTIGVVHVAWQPQQPSPQPSPSGSLLRNGSFEEPSVGGGSWRFFQSLPGWQLASGTAIEVQSRAAGNPAHGAQLVELDSRSSSAIYQDVRTVPGATYELRLAFSPRPGRGIEDNRLAVRFGGREIGVVEASGQGRSDTSFTYVTYRVVADARISRVELADVGRSDGFGTYVDDVSLTLVAR